MAKTKKAPQNLLTPSPKELQKALAQSAKQAEALAAVRRLMPLTEKQLLAHNAKQDLGTELLMSIHKIKAGHI